MLMKDSKIKMVKQVPGFSLGVGTVFTVDDITEGMVIQFSCFMGAGIMSWDEFRRYFEEFHEEPKKKEEWSDWKLIGELSHITSNIPFGDIAESLECDSVAVWVRQKGRMIQVRLMLDPGSSLVEDCISVKATAKCSPYDKYDFRKGYYLALSRAMDKLSKELIGE